MNGPFENEQMNNFFATLSPVVQQSVLHSGADVKTLAQLQSVAQKMGDSHKENSYQ